MEIAALLKAVPRSESVRFDPERKTVVREGVELVLNPFDQRALRVALELRRPTDRVTAVALGPPNVLPLLQEARALGADAALHLCDAAFAGSDLLASSAALAGALRTLGAGLVLTGARSTDSDTGLAPAEVGARLDWPVVSGVRALRRRADRATFELDVDTPEGWATVEVGPPAVLAVGEKIAKPLPLEPERLGRLSAQTVATVGPSGVGLSPAEVGAFGSPTTVESVVPVAPVRRGRALADGDVPARVEAAMAILRPLLGRPPPPPAPLPWPPDPGSAREVVVLASDPDGAVDPDVSGLLSKLRRSLPVSTVTAAVYGPPPGAADRLRLETSGALGGYVLDPGGPFDSADVARGLGSVLDQRRRTLAVVLPASPFGREVAGQLAAPRGLGAIGDAVEVGAVADGTLEWSKPSFEGSTIARVRCRSTPVVVTMPLGLDPPARDGRPTGDPWTPLAPPAPRARVLRRGSQVEPAEPPEPAGAEVVVAVGVGIGGPEGLDRLRPTLRRWGAALVGTRRVVDAGWLPSRRQVGLTGRALAPRLAVLLGVRGSVNHMVGWARAGAVLAVNRDAEAPVFAHADAGIVGSVDEVLPGLEAPVAELLAAPRSA